MKKILKKARTKLLVFLTHGVALPMLKKWRKPQEFIHEKDDLRMFPEGSLGHDLLQFLEKRNLPLLSHYARHDLKHVLLDYDTTDEGEVCLQSFMLGNGRVSFPVLATVIYGWLTMPEYWKKMREAYRKGKQCPLIHYWPWNSIVWEPTIELRNKIFKNIKIEL